MSMTDDEHTKFVCDCIFHYIEASLLTHMMVKYYNFQYRPAMSLISHVLFIPPLQPLVFRPGVRLLSYLPLAHMYERLCQVCIDIELLGIR